jgi:oxygen-independent coproporphyrinogen III oxidase
MPVSSLFDADLVRRYDRPGPRYTSYPTALDFHDGFGPAEYRAAAMATSSGGERRDLSLYVHVPFCQSPCFYCGCNKVITRDRSRAREYLGHLGTEIGLQGALFDRDRTVRQLHFGGGTPTFLDDDELAALLARLGESFTLTAAAEREYSIEIDPRTVDEARLARLVDLGFNRISLGVQDFDPEVQRAVNRVQPAEATLKLIDAARRLGIPSLSVDLIYGLPRQTPESFDRTLGELIAVRPSRLAVYSYAHLPQLFKPQRQIRDAELPSAEDKLALLGLTIERLSAAGYVYIGLDHFALEDDELVRAQAAGTLQRNFQGYSTHADADLVALGVSAISRVGDTYAQNAKTLGAYYRHLERGELPIERGIALDAEDRLRREVIQHLMCATRLDFAAIGRAFGVDFEAHFAAELASLEPLLKDGLAERDAAGLRVTTRGRLLLRHLAMAFDGRLAAARSASGTVRHSRAI